MNWRSIPFVRLLLPFILGLLLHFGGFAHSLPIMIAMLVGGSGLLLSLCRPVAYRWRWWPGLCLLLLFCAAGWQSTQWAREDQAPAHFSGQLPAAEGLQLYGSLEHAQRRKDHWRCKLQVKACCIQDSVQYSEGNLLLYIQADSAQPPPVAGSQIWVRARPKRIAPPRNPNTFDFARYMRFQNVHFQAYVGSRDWYTQSHKPPKLPFAGWRRQLLPLIDRYIAGPEERAVAKALVLGYREDLSKDLRNQYQQTGAIHVLAVSGLHVGLVYLLLAGCFKCIRWESPVRKKWEAAGSIVGIWCFALLTGGSPSVLRAATMFSFLIVGMAFQRNTQVYNTLAASAFCLLWMQPHLLGQVGFQLSYLAVLGIVYFQPKLYRLWTPPFAALDYAWKLLTVSLAAQLTTLPLTIYYFHQIPLYFWLSGWVVVPAAGLVLGLGLGLLLVGTLQLALAHGIGWLLEKLLWGVNQSIAWIDALPGGLITDIWWSWEQAVAAYLLLVLCVVVLENPGRKWGYRLALAGCLFTGMCQYFALEKRYAPKLTVYHHRTHPLMDIVCRDTLYCLGTEAGLSNRSNASYRSYLGNLPLCPLPVDTCTSLFCRGLLQVGHKKGIWLHADFPLDSIPIRVDFVIVSRGAPELPLAHLPEQLIIDATHSRAAAKRWEQWAREHRVPFYNVYKQGYCELF